MNFFSYSPLLMRGGVARNYYKLPPLIVVAGG